MELPDLGKSCEHQNCSVQDYLPLNCSKCSHLFCSQHIQAHGCMDIQQEEYRNIQAEKVKRDQCALDSCDQNLTEHKFQLCDQCRLKYCLAHRHQSAHGCDLLLINRNIQAKDQKSQEIQDILQSKGIQHAKAVRDQKKINVPASKSQKVEIMRLKMKAKGDDKIPLKDRYYLKCQLFNGENLIPFFVSRNISVGRLIDVICQLLQVTNKNNQVEPEERWVLSIDNKTLGRTGDSNTSQDISGQDEDENVLIQEASLIILVKDKDIVV